MFLPSPWSLNFVLPVADAATDNAAADKAATNDAAADKSSSYHQTLAWLSQLCSVLSRAQTISQCISISQGHSASTQDWDKNKAILWPCLNTDKSKTIVHRNNKMFPLLINRQHNYLFPVMALVASSEPSLWRKSPKMLNHRIAPTSW